MSTSFSHTHSAYAQPLCSPPETFPTMDTPDAHTSASLFDRDNNSVVKPTTIPSGSTTTPPAWSSSSWMHANRSNTYPVVSNEPQLIYNPALNNGPLKITSRLQNNDLALNVDPYGKSSGPRSSPTINAPPAQWEWGGWSHMPGRMPETMNETSVYARSSSSVPSAWTQHYRAMPPPPTGSMEVAPSVALRPSVPMASSYAIPTRKDVLANERPPQEISTLFLAGFPEDITDREFSNMFLFAKGFEASMLKYPNTNAVQQLKPDEAEARRAADKRVSGPTGLGAEKEGAGRDASDPQPSPKSKQIIGFAKFSCREEALQARDVLNGFRIDSERGCILKAELAKKNLHTKRSASYVVNKHTHPSQPNRSTALRDTHSMLTEAPLSAPILVPSQSRNVMPPSFTTPQEVLIGDPRTNSVAWSDPLDYQASNGMFGSLHHDAPSHVGTTAPINEMVARLETFSKNIPTYASSGTSSLASRSESPSLAHPRMGAMDASTRSGTEPLSSPLDFRRSPSQALGPSPNEAVEQLQSLSLSGDTSGFSTKNEMNPLFTMSQSSDMISPPTQYPISSAAMPHSATSRSSVSPANSSIQSSTKCVNAYAAHAAQPAQGPSPNSHALKQDPQESVVSCDPKDSSTSSSSQVDASQTSTTTNMNKTNSGAGGLHVSTEAASPREQHE